MKISYKHLIENMNQSVGIKEISNALFQLGHEHEIDGEIFDIEFTPNRGDCLSIRGLLRDLNSFYDLNIDNEIYKNKINDLKIDFTNNLIDFCPKISFLHVEIDKIPDVYSSQVEDYFLDLNVKKNNFFTDISNYLSYETGQPTHCYKNSAIDGIKLDCIKSNQKFLTLLDKTIELDKNDIAFFDNNNNVINLAGIVGGKSTACNQSTKSVLIECAYFYPEKIIGKTIKHNINSEAAYKFERNCDSDSHDYVLRRFLKIIEDHSNILNAEIFTYNNLTKQNKEIPFDFEKIKRIIGIEIKCNDVKDYLKRLGFMINEASINIPNHRHDIENLNDISEEVARVIGYDNIKPKPIQIPKARSKIYNEELKIKNFLVDNGFYEVINDPFVSTGNDISIEVDNPLDSNRKYLRIDTKKSLLENLLFNERRQKDSIKLFEITDIYINNHEISKRVLGIIASGRVDRNYKDFSKKITDKYLKGLFEKRINANNHINIIDIPRAGLNSKLKNPIVFTEIEIDSEFSFDYSRKKSNNPNPCYKYIPVSEFPSSSRDLSFSISDYSNSEKLQNYLLNFENKLIKEIFIFDYFFNEKNKEIKVGFRLTFQDNKSTITETDVNNIMDVIIKDTLKLNGVSIPGLKHE